MSAEGGLPAGDADTDPANWEYAPCGHLSALPDGTIIRVNQTLLDLLGRERDDVIGHRFADLLTAGGRIYHETHYAPLLRMQGHVREIAVDVVRADGERVPVLVNTVVHADPEGRPAVVRTAVFPATERRRYEQELLLARERAMASEARARLLAKTLQGSLIPPEPPTIPGLDVGAAYRPAGAGDEVGGDFYDVFEVSERDWAIVLGDVCGKGADAARVTALARYTARAAAMQHRTPASVLRLLNAALLREGTDRFCTVVYARVRPRDDGSALVTIASGGHPLPLRAGVDRAVFAVGRPGDLLGVLEDAEIHDLTVMLGPGEHLTFFTDGVTEGRGDADFYGETRLHALLADHGSEPADRLAAHLVDDVVTFSGGETRDDIAVVVVGVPAPPGGGEGTSGDAPPDPIH